MTMPFPYGVYKSIALTTTLQYFKSSKSFIFF
jgi:hypothetical protein